MEGFFVYLYKLFLRMMLKIYYLFFISILVNTDSISQNWYKCELYFKTGEVKKGIGQIYEPNIRFKANEKSEVNKYLTSDVDSLIIEYKENSPVKMIHINISEDEIHYKPNFLGKLLNTDSETHFVSRIINDRLVLYSHICFYGQIEESHQDYYLQRNNEKVKFITSFRAFYSERKFRRIAAEYFSDCPQLVKLIEEKKFTRRQIVDIVKMYNMVEVPQ